MSNEVTITIKVRCETLQAALDMLCDPSECYPTLDQAGDFLELNWDLIEGLAEHARAQGLNPSHDEE